LLLLWGLGDIAHDGAGMPNGRQPSKEQRVDEEDRTQPDRDLDEHIAGICTENGLAHAPADGAAEAALFRLLEHHGKREQKAHDHFDYIQETNEERRHFFNLSIRPFRFR
jgi:hypothetical protein